MDLLVKPRVQEFYRVSSHWGMKPVRARFLQGFKDAEQSL